MAYTSLAALTRRFGEAMLVQLTDRGELATGEVDAAVVGQALLDADAVIDASLAVRYRLPLETVPPLIANLALTIAIYQLHRTRPDEKIERDHDQALRDARELAAGTKKLDVAGAEPPTSDAGGVVFTDRPRLFTPDTLRGFVLMDEVKGWIEAIPALAGRVQGAAKLAELTARGSAATADRAAFVLPLGLRGGTASAAAGLFRQSVDRLVGVVLMVRNLGDATGEKAAVELDGLIAAVIAAVAGRDVESAIGVWTLQRGELISIAAGTITYQLDFAIEDQLRIER